MRWLTTRLQRWLTTRLYPPRTEFHFYLKFLLRYIIFLWWRFWELTTSYEPQILRLFWLFFFYRKINDLQLHSQITMTMKYLWMLWTRWVLSTQLYIKNDIHEWNLTFLIHNDRLNIVLTLEIWTPNFLHARPLLSLRQIWRGMLNFTHEKISCFVSDKKTF